MDHRPTKVAPRRRIISLKHFLILMFACIIAPIAAAGWTDLYRNFLERNVPQVMALEPPRGIGTFPVQVRFRLSDPDAGLDEIVIRLRQKTLTKELLRQSFNGKKSDEVEVQIDGEKSGLAEGIVNVEVRVFDRSFWSNAAEASLQLKVDYQKPRVEVLSTQHNARLGGSQLVLYQAFDEDLAVSGIKVANKTFLGFPASGLDREFKDQSLAAAVYAVPLEDNSDAGKIKVFAEDWVGNAISTTFYNKIADRSQREVSRKISDQFMREKVRSLAEEYRKIRNSADSSFMGGSGSFSTDELIKDFHTVNEKLRAFNEAEIEKILARGLRNEAHWSEPFLRQNANTSIQYGDIVRFTYNDQQIDSTVSVGEDLLMAPGQEEALAANGGIVLLSEEIGVYGWTVAIDHGLGVTSLYSWLDRPLVAKGDEVKRGQPIGVVGRSGFALQKALHFEMRIQGVPVDPREWWEASWFYSHIIDKVNELKKALGIPVYIRLR